PPGRGEIPRPQDRAAAGAFRLAALQGLVRRRDVPQPREAARDRVPRAIRRGVLRAQDQVEVGVMADQSGTMGKTGGKKQNTNFSASAGLRKRAHALIPGGSHTYAKGDDQYPILSPSHVTHGLG